MNLNDYWYVIFSLILLASCSNKNQPLPYYNTADFTPQWLDNQADIKQKIKHQIADFEFINQYGEKFGKQHLQNKIYIANFFFTSCTSICPQMTENLKKVQSVFQADKDIILLSYSVMPWLDSLPRLRAYAQREAILPAKWHLLTGRQSEIYKLARQSYFAEEEMGFLKDSSDFLHTERMILVDKNHHIRGVYNGTLALEVEKLIADIRVLKAEK
jgi:protein SCO1